MVRMLMRTRRLGLLARPLTWRVVASGKQLSSLPVSDTLSLFASLKAAVLDQAVMTFDTAEKAGD